VGFSALTPYSDRPVYAGVANCSIYVAGAARRRGIGTRLADAIAEDAGTQGFYKLVGRLFTTNEASMALVKHCGFREVGIHRRHGRLDGEWRDVLVVERLVGEAAS
jgi:phosphinothricin acetyltransferase